MTNTWHSKPWEMTRGEFAKHADDNTIIKLRLPLHIGSVKVGFELKSARKSTPHKHQEYAELKLKMSKFIYDEQFEQLNTDASLNIYLENNKLIMPLVRIISDSESASGLKASVSSQFKKRSQISQSSDQSKSRFNSRKLEEQSDMSRNSKRSFKHYEVQKMSLADIHHLNLSLLRKCVNDRGKIHSAHRNGLPAKYQRAVRAAVIRARYLALLPYVPAHRKVTTTLSHGNKNETSSPEKGNGV